VIVMLAELPNMFAESYDDRDLDAYQSQAIMQSLDKAKNVFDQNELKPASEAPYEYMQFSDFLFRTATRPYRLMWRHRINPLKVPQLYYLLPFVVEEAIQDNLEFSKTLRRSES